MTESYYMRKKRERREAILEDMEAKEAKERKLKNIKKTKKLSLKEILDGKWNTLTELRTYLQKYRPDVKINGTNGYQLFTSVGCFGLFGFELNLNPDQKVDPTGLAS